jgi:hypothetical protein
MCKTNSWVALEVIKETDIIASRSDGLHLLFYILEFRSIKEFIERLEEFRNCKCLPNAPCSKHIEESERINANS